MSHDKNERLLQRRSYFMCWELKFNLQERERERAQEIQFTGGRRGGERKQTTFYWWGIQRVKESFDFQEEECRVSSPNYWMIQEDLVT